MGIQNFVKLWKTKIMAAKKSKPKKLQFGNITMYQKYGGLHNDRGPAYIDSDEQIVQYYRYGKLHRTDGPAYINKTHGYHKWYLNGKYYEFSDWCKITPLDKDRLTMLILEHS